MNNIPKTTWLTILLIVAFLAAGIFAYQWWQAKGKLVRQTEECLIKKPDPDGYLLKICRYLNEHEDTIIPNREPDDYSIKSIEEGQYSRFEGDEYKVTDVLVIRLDCCGTGNLAYVDKETNEVIGFSFGDI